jgi:hypothetical protein
MRDSSSCSAPTYPDDDVSTNVEAHRQVWGSLDHDTARATVSNSSSSNERKMARCVEETRTWLESDAPQSTTYASATLSVVHACIGPYAAAMSHSLLNDSLRSLDSLGLTLCGALNDDECLDTLCRDERDGVAVE